MHCYLLSVARLRRGLVFMAAAWAGAWLATAASAQPPGGPPAPVEVVRAEEGDFTPRQMFVGTVRPVQRAVIGSAVDGRVVEFPLNQGQRVKEGQAVAKLLTETIALELRAAQAELDLRKHELNELKNGTRPEELAQAQAREDRTKALMDFARQRYERMKSLAEGGGAISQEDLEESWSATIAAQENYRESQAASALAKAGPRQEKIDQAAAQVAIQEANVARLEDQIAKHTVISRITGYVTAEHTEVGQWVKRGDPVAEVAKLDEVEVAAQAPEDYVAFIRAGETAPVEIPSLKSRRFEGTILRVVPQADERARTFPVLVLVKNDESSGEPLIKAGMLARVQLPTGAPRRSLVVHKDALVPGAGQMWVVDPDPKNPKLGKVRPAPVQVGESDGERIEVLKGLKAGELVVALGNERLRPGMSVEIKQRAAKAN